MERLTNSFKHAINGLKYVIRYEKNARIHLLFAIIIIIFSFIIGLDPKSFVLILSAIVLVFLAEIINTAFEKTLDIVEPNHHPQVKIIKDMAAGAVLVTAASAIIIGVVIFTPYLFNLWQ